LVARQDALGSPWRARVGVALAAIQGLHQMMQQKDAKLKQQSREISALKRKRQVIEAKLGCKRQCKLSITHNFLRLVSRLDNFLAPVSRI
jgi:hypothetical protein